MAGEALIALPSGVDPDSADVKTVPANSGAGTTDLLWIVPSGEAWLITAVTAKVTSIAPGTSDGLCQYLDQSRNIIWWNQVGREVTAPATYWQSATLNYNDTPVPAANVSANAFGLPWIVLLPGWAFDFGLQMQGAGSCSFAALNHFATVTFWEWGAGSSGGVTEQLGPFMFVPGPNQSVAA